jgi:hypothetical protein
MEHPTIAQKDFYYAGRLAPRLARCRSRSARSGGNRCTITASAGAPHAIAKRSPVRGISALELGLELAMSNAGNDEFSIAFT